jgi:hypothetical protein
MATTMVEVQGIVEWPKLFEFNRDKPEWNDTDGLYNLRIILDDDDVAKLKQAGTQKKFETDPENRGMVFAPSRPHKAKNEWAGGPPKVAGPDGTPWNVDEDGLIGNGSVCRVLIAVYDAGKLKGTRLEAVQVVDHVPYISDKEGSGAGGAGVNSFFKDMTKNGDSAASKPQAVKAKKVAAALAEDEIPF